MESRGIVDAHAAGSERAFVGPARRRRTMAARVTIGQVWRRRRDGGTLRIQQVHRKDRVVDAIDAGGARRCVTFDELRRLWREDEDRVA